MNILSFENFFPDTVSHGFFGRRGGVSSGLYDSLNCSYQSKDLAEHIDENRLRVLNKLNGKNLSTLKQIHSDICFPIEHTCMKGDEEGDALVTRNAGHVIACLTADCAPVLFYGEDKGGLPVIGAAHAGWGGALKGVLESTIKAMMNLGAELQTVKAAIGPCLGKVNFEVSHDFIEQFVLEDAVAAEMFDKHHDTIQFNFPAYIEFRLKRAGVVHITNANLDTYANEGDYFSYRRATHRGEPDYGRQISAIMIRST